MRRPAVLLVAAALVCAQAPPRAHIAIGLDAIDGTRLKADLTFLSSDALEGRRSLERGSEVAIQWIASEFAKAGLKPAAGDSFLQYVPLIEYTTDRDHTSLLVRRNGAATAYRAPDATS